MLPGRRKFGGNSATCGAGNEQHRASTKALNMINNNNVNYKKCQYSSQPSAATVAKPRYTRRESMAKATLLREPRSMAARIKPSQANRNHRMDDRRNGSGTYASTTASPLPQCKVKRNYACTKCNYYTQNPRFFLFHQKNVHAEKIRVYECSQCLYASKHSQKLQRHIQMVHVAGKGKAAAAAAATAYKLKVQRVEKVDARAPMGNAVPSAAKRSKMSASAVPVQTRSERDDDDEREQDHRREPSTTDDRTVYVRCSVCPFGSHSQILVNRHEKVAHLKKKFFRCMKCNYVTHMKARYTKHVKYHTMPMIKCDDCDFRTPYKWNLDRHNRNHTANGAYKCSSCSFSADIKQSLTVHEMNHHVPPIGNVLPAAKRRYRVGASDAPGSAVDGTEIVTYETTKDGVVEIMTETKSTPNSCSKVNPVKSIVKKSVVNTAGNISVNLFACSLCDYTSPYEYELKAHGERMHSNVSSAVPKKKSAPRPLPKLIPITDRQQQQQQLLRNTAADRPPSPAFKMVSTTAPVSEEDFNRLKAARSSLLGDFVSLIDDEGFATPARKTALHDGDNAADPRCRSESGSPGSKSTASSSSSSAKRPSGSSFFDKLKAKVDETSNLVCPVCRHESKCLSEYMCHQRTHNDDDDDDDDETRPGEKAPFVSSLELKSTRCQHCRKRCKTSAELRVHLLSTCEAAAAAIRAGVKRENAAVLAAESSAALIKDECHEDNGDTKSSMAAAGDLGGTNSENGIHHHPMENKIFVWNTVAPPPEKEEDYDQEDNEGDGVDMAETTKCRRLSVDSAVEDQSDLNVPGGGPEFYSSLVLQPHQQFHRRDRKMYKTVFKCPHCTFWASTASRFHVHIVGHLNKKPFECSFCAYRSNWRWDITKHIRLKSVRDDSHQGAKVLMTDETGRRNYTKYNKYLTVMEVDDKTDCDGGARGVGSSSGKVQSQQQQQQQQQRASGRKRTQKTHGQLTVVLATTAAGKPATSGRVQASTDGPTHPKVAALSVRALAAAAALKAESEKNQTLTVGKKLKVGTADKTMRSPLAPNSTENKKTVWKCKKCFFRDCDRITVLNHVKAHYRRGEFNGQSEQRSNNVDVNNCGADQNRREPISIKIKTKPFRTTDNIVDHNVKHCTMCDETVKNVTELKAHMLTHQIPEETKYRCEYCPFWCEKKKAMLDHMKYAHEMDNGNNGGCGVGEQNDSLAVTSVRSSEETLMDDFERGFDDTEVKDEPMDEDEQDGGENDDEERKEIEVANSNWAAATTIPLPPIYDSGVKPRIPLTAEKRRSIFLDDGQFDDDDDDDEHTEIPHGLGLKASADRCIPCNVCWYYSTSKSDMAAHKQLHVRRGALYNCDRCVYNVTKLSLLYEHYRCAHMVEEPQKLYPEEAVIRTSRNEMFTKNGEVGGGENGDDGVDLDDTPPLLWSYKDGTFGKVYKCRYCPHTNQRRHNTMEHEKMHSDHPQQQQQPKQEATQADGDSSNALHSSSNTSVLETSPMHPCKRCTYMCNNAGVLSSHLKVHSEDYGVAVGFVDTTVRDLVQTKALEYVIELESRLDTVCSTTNDDGDDTIEGETKKSSVDAGSESGTVKFCQRCPARFLNADDLLCHSRYHRYRWSWTCDQCSFSARTRQFVDQHKPVHGPEYESVTVRLLEKHGVSLRYPKPDEYDDRDDISAAAVVELKSPRSTIKTEEECVERGAVVGREEEKVQRNRENGGDEFAAAKSTSNRRESARRSVSSEDSANEKTIVAPISSVSKTLVTSSAKGYVKQFTCDRCPGRFFKTAALQYHLTLHGGPGKHKCRRCDYAVSTYGNLVRHESVHEDLPAREKTVRPKTVRAVATGVAAKSGYAALPPPPPTIPLSQDGGGGGMSLTGDSSRVTITTTTTTTTTDDDDDDDDYLEDDDEIVGSPNTTGSYKTTKSANSANRSPEASSGSPDTEFGVQMLGHPNFYYPTTVKNGVAKQKRYKCAKCPSAFDKRDQYKVHLTLHGADDKYKCDKCDYSVKYTANYAQHQRKHALDAELRSAAVAAAIENRVEIKEEMLEGDADKEGAATVGSGEDCGEGDSGKDGRSRLDREHTKCIETSNSKRAADANRSLRRCCDGAATPVTPTVDRRQMFRNEISDEQTAYELNAAYAEVYKCAECPFECGGRTELDKHSVHHSSKRWKRLCPFCTYVTQTESDLSDHLRVHFARPSDTTADFVHRAENENGQIEYYGKRVYPAREGGGGDRKDDGQSEENDEEEPFFVFGDDRFDGSIRFQPQCESICIDYNDNSTTMTGGPRGEETAAKPAFVKMLTAGRVELVDGGGKKKKKK